MKKEVVGKVTQSIRQKYAEPVEVRRAFACGFMTGQAEKVYLGVCRAAMFRPSEKDFKWLLKGTQEVASNFDLTVTVLESHCPDTPFEIWIHSGTIGEWLEYEVNSPMWHGHRAEACGIPTLMTDSEYHLREGYAERCD